MPGGKHLNMQAWSPDEDQIILEMVNAEGPKWSRIVQRLPGRTVSSVRNRWQRIEKGRKLREAGVESKNRCHACGEPKRGHVCLAKMRNVGPGPQAVFEGAVVEGAIMPIEQGGGTPPFEAQASFPPPPLPLPRSTRSSANVHSSAQVQAQAAQKAFTTGALGQSGSSLFPPANDQPPLFTIDLGAASSSHASSQGPPRLERSNTSFFGGLADSEVFSPRTRELFASFVDSPKAENAAPLAHLANDTAAPPTLKRMLSGEIAPKLTRSISSYLDAIQSVPPQPPPPLQTDIAGAASSMPPPPISLQSVDSQLLNQLVGDMPSSLPSAERPGLMRRRSSRLSVGFLQALAD